ncbi:MAG: polysaccharide biosynthesis/export family protein, partial [Burkholderiales bacterium]
MFLIASLVMPAAPVAAQTVQPYQYGIYPNPAATQPAPGGAAPVQTPTITNAPVLTQPIVQPRETLVVPAAAPAQPALQSSAPEKNEFQDFIAKSTGQVLPMFGYNLFEGAPSTFAPVENVPVTPDYVIGPGDELLIRAWGQIDIDYRAVVDRNG